MSKVTDKHWVSDVFESLALIFIVGLITYGCNSRFVTIQKCINDAPKDTNYSKSVEACRSLK